ncbi:hypothetical protein NGUA10_00016 [Salmonella enterica]|nr:hypothetical protein NGUA10_00016 [Salmonella enterica]
MLVAQHFTANALAAHIFTDGDELHFGSDDPLAGIMKLRHAVSGFGAFWRQQTGKTQIVQAIVGQTFSGVSRATVV